MAFSSPDKSQLCMSFQKTLDFSQTNTLCITKDQTRLVILYLLTFTNHFLFKFSWYEEYPPPSLQHRNGVVVMFLERIQANSRVLFLMWKTKQVSGYHILQFLVNLALYLENLFLPPTLLFKGKKFPDRVTQPILRNHRTYSWYL